MKKESPFLKKSVGSKPPPRKEMKKGGLGQRGVRFLRLRFLFLLLLRLPSLLPAMA